MLPSLPLKSVRSSLAGNGYALKTSLRPFTAFTSTDGTLDPLFQSLANIVRHRRRLSRCLHASEKLFDSVEARVYLVFKIQP